MLAQVMPAVWTQDGASHRHFLNKTKKFNKYIQNLVCMSDLMLACDWPNVHPWPGMFRSVTLALAR